MDTGACYLDVYIDGVKVAENISGRAPSYSPQVTLYKNTELGMGVHTVRVVYVSGGGWFNLDAFGVYNAQPFDTDAGLTALKIGGTEVDPEQTEQSVVSESGRISVEASAASGASVSYLDASGGAISDPSDIVLADGINVVRIVVTAEDGVTTETYVLNISYDAPKISTLEILPTSIVEGMAANVRIKVSGENLEGRAVSVYLSTADGRLFETAVPESGEVIMRIDKAPAAGIYSVIAEAENSEKSTSIVIRQYNANIWDISLTEHDGGLVAIFNEYISAGASGYKATTLLPGFANAFGRNKHVIP